MTPGGLLARVVRSGLVESVHTGHLLVAGPGGAAVRSVGDPDEALWPRSALKPLQAVALLRAGLDVDAEGLALACSSHSGTPAHLAVVRRVLASAGLAERDLQNTPDLPLDAESADAWRAAGHGRSPVTQNCSGKHAAMLATCVAAGWDPATYRDPAHPLQVHVRDVVGELTGVPVERVGVDGCGAPLLSTTVRGLARAFGRIAAAPVRERGTDLARVAVAMGARPDLVGGPGRDVSAFLAAVPGLVAKDGAEGVYAAGLPDGSSVAFKVADGGARPRAAILAAALELLLASGAGADLAGPGLAASLAAVRAAGWTPVLGHGVPVGEVVAVLDASGAGPVTGPVAGTVG